MQGDSPSDWWATASSPSAHLVAQPGVCREGQNDLQVAVGRRTRCGLRGSAVAGATLAAGVLAREVWHIGHSHAARLDAAATERRYRVTAGQQCRKLRGSSRLNQAWRRLRTVWQAAGRGVLEVGVGVPWGAW